MHWYCVSLLHKRFCYRENLPDWPKSPFQIGNNFPNRHFLASREVIGQLLTSSFCMNGSRSSSEHFILMPNLEFLVRQCMSSTIFFYPKWSIRSELKPYSIVLPQNWWRHLVMTTVKTFALTEMSSGKKKYLCWENSFRLQTSMIEVSFCWHAFYSLWVSFLSCAGRFVLFW